MHPPILLHPDPKREHLPQIAQQSARTVPTNENGTGLLRRWFPKSTDLGVHDTDILRLVEYRINTIPRRSLGWDTAAARYHAAVAMTG